MTERLEYSHAPGNLYHKLLLAKGQHVVKDYRGGFAHGYEFDCGCRRVYSLSTMPPLGQESESLTPCEKHAVDPDILAVK